MSVVTDTILLYPVTGCWDDEMAILDTINESFKDNACGKFVHVEDANPGHTFWYGGTKVLQMNVAIGAFNHLDYPGLCDGIMRKKCRLLGLGCDFCQIVYQAEDDLGATLDTLWREV